jgi:hypothetical protein
MGRSGIRCLFDPGYEMEKIPIRDKHCFYLILLYLLFFVDFLLNASPFFHVITENVKKPEKYGK